MGTFITIVTEDERNEYKNGESSIYYRRVDTATYENISRPYKKKKGNDRTGKPIIEEDTSAINDDVLDYAIKEWKGIKNPVTGEDVPCSRENKLRLPSQIKADIVEKCMEGSTEIEEKKT